MALLGQIFGGGKQQGGGMSPMMMALMGVLAYRTIKGKGRLADMLGMGGGAAAGQTNSQPGGGGMLGGLSGLMSGGMGGFAGMLSGLSGGNPGSALSDGLQHLMERFQQNGQGDKVESWVSKSPNKPIAPSEMEQGLGQDMVGWLTKETGMNKDDLLAGLSRELPQVVDRLTPKGKVPNAEEANQHIAQQQTH